jgi:CMP-N-acetylneuraminic acid synthetase
MKGMKIIAVITARSGSKGVPEKNIKMLAGKPLIAHTIEQSVNSNRD